jgi:hypothetical protein
MAVLQIFLAIVMFIFQSHSMLYDLCSFNEAVK